MDKTVTLLLFWYGALFSLCPFCTRATQSLLFLNLQLLCLFSPIVPLPTTPPSPTSPWARKSRERKGFLASTLAFSVTVLPFDDLMAFLSVSSGYHSFPTTNAVLFCRTSFPKEAFQLLGENVPEIPEDLGRPSLEQQHRK